VKRETKYRIVFNIEERRPGCVILQAALCGTAHILKDFPKLFLAETWLTAPTGMAVYEATEKQLHQLSALAHAAAAKERSERDAKRDARVRRSA